MNKLRIIFLSFIFNLIFLSFSFSEIVKKIQITGNSRISDETILMFSGINEGKNFNNSMLNEILKAGPKKVGTKENGNDFVMV